MASFTYGKKRYGSRGYRGLANKATAVVDEEKVEEEEVEPQVSEHASEVETYLSPEEELTLDHPSSENQEITEVSDEEQVDTEADTGIFSPVDDEPGPHPDEHVKEPEVTTVDEEQDVPEDQEAATEEINEVLDRDSVSDQEAAVVADGPSIPDETSGDADVPEREESLEPSAEEIAQELAIEQDPIKVNEILERLQREDPDKHIAVLDALNRGVTVEKEVTPPTPAEDLGTVQISAEKTTEDHKKEIESRKDSDDIEEKQEFNTSFGEMMSNMQEAQDAEEQGSVENSDDGVITL